MEIKNFFTKILALVGTGLTWLPIVAPIFFSVLFLISERILRFDYMMPAELFPVVGLGSALLIWAALRARIRRKLVIWSVASAIVMLLSSMTMAQVTGLASGEIEANGIWWVLVLALLIGYDLAVVATGVGGVLLIRDLFTSSRLSARTT